MTEIRRFEEQLLQSDFRRDREAVAALLAEDFREFGSSGRVWSRQQILDKLGAEPPFKAVMQDFQAVELAAGVVLATYRVIAENRVSLRSSIWKKHDGQWRMVFHQGTPSVG